VLCLLVTAYLAYANEVTLTYSGYFFSYYNPDPRLDTPYLLPRLKKPMLLVVVAGTTKWYPVLIK
jgi:hypothetical protein